jgi:D-sedoheptulose 7-phosphate isomerase
MRPMRSHEVVRQSLRESAATLAETNASEMTLSACVRFADAALETLRAGGRLFACGNGGSMSDAMHFTEEWTGRFRNDRRALPALSFCDPVTLSCIANDFGWEEVFARQVEAHGRQGDLLLVLSTSGDSENIVRAVRAAAERDMVTVGLLGRQGGKVGADLDIPIVVPHATTADRIQEVHIQMIHAVIEAVERQLFPENYSD